MKISGSLFSKSSEFTTYANHLEYAGINYIHIDYLDGKKAPIPIEDLTPKISQLPYDVHIISQHIHDDIIYALNKTSTAYLCVQYENLIDKQDINKLSLFNGFRGVAFTMCTSIEIIRQYVGSIDFILIMCSEPGVSGAVFNKENIDRIRLIHEEYPELPIHVDGGIDNEKIKLMDALGVSLCVSGSYLASTDGMELIQRVCELKFMKIDIQVAEIMTLRKNLIPIKETGNFYELLENINQSQMGVAFVEDNNQNFIGIITDGDARRAILNNRENVFVLTVQDIVNKSAYSTNKDKKLTEVFLERMLLNKAVAVIPVIENSKLVGVIDLKKYF